MTASPGRDQKAARLRDLERLRELIRPYSTDTAAPIDHAIARMPAAEHFEARDILARIGALGEDPDKAAGRQEILLDLAQAETVLHEILARPHYKIRDGQVVTDPATGEPVRDDTVERQARAELRKFERLRSRLTGLPVEDDLPPAELEGLPMTFFGVTLLTAIATLGLAVLAVVTAWYARKAFREQSREVAAIEQQVKDEQEVTRQQAELLKVQTGQLEVLRAQFDDQRMINELQAKDLEESLEERRRLREAAERQQADDIGFEMTTTSFPRLPEEEGYDFAIDPGDPVHAAVVSNESRRPISKVQCRIGGASTGSPFPRTRTENEYAVLAGRPSDQTPTGRLDPNRLIDLAEPHSGLRIRPGETYVFVFEINSHWALELLPVVAVRFTDDAGLHWEIDRDQHLRRLADRDW